MNKASELERRLEALETRVAFVDEAQNRLSDALVRQQQDLERLERTLELLLERISSLSEAGVHGVGEERPPHY